MPSRYRASPFLVSHSIPSFPNGWRVSQQQRQRSIRFVYFLRSFFLSFKMLARSVKSLQVTGVKVVSRSFVSSSVNNGSYSEEQAKKGRPISPHVEIYKFPPAALTSITNRVTGGLLSVGKCEFSFLEFVNEDNIIPPCFLDRHDRNWRPRSRRC